MTIAEKYYRLFYKVKPEIKLTNEQWKVVNMMHQCLKENNKPKLPKGTIVVNKKNLLSHLNLIQQAVDSLDKIYDNKNLSDNDRGKNVAKVRNALELSTHSIKHFELNIELKKL
jgi:hypothetical protein